MDLPSVYLEVTSHVDPTWDNAEPQAYLTDLRGNILVRVDDQDDGMAWADVLDAHSDDMGCYLALLNSKGSGYSTWMETTLDPVERNLLVLDRIRIQPERRGHGNGLYAAELMMNGFGLSDGGVACQPSPYER